MDGLLRSVESANVISNPLFSCLWIVVKYREAFVVLRVTGLELPKIGL